MRYIAIVVNEWEFDHLESACAEYGVVVEIMNEIPGYLTVRLTYNFGQLLMKALARYGELNMLFPEDRVAYN